MSVDVNDPKAIARLLHDLAGSYRRSVLDCGCESDAVFQACNDFAESVSLSAHKAQTVAFLVDSFRYFSDHGECAAKTSDEENRETNALT